MACRMQFIINLYWNGWWHIIFLWQFLLKGHKSLLEQWHKATRVNLLIILLTGFAELHFANPDHILQHRWDNLNRIPSTIRLLIKAGPTPQLSGWSYIFCVSSFIQKWIFFFGRSWLPFFFVMMKSSLEQDCLSLFWIGRVELHSLLDIMSALLFVSCMS